MRDYVLPDYTHIKRGYVRPEEETTGRAQGNEQVCIDVLSNKSPLIFLQTALITV